MAHLSTAAIQEARLCLLASEVIKDSADPSDAMLVLLSGPLSKFTGEIFDAEKLSAAVKEDYGWSIPATALEYFLPKFRQLKWVERASNLTANIYRVSLTQPEIRGTNRDTTQELSELGESFLEFSKGISPISARVLPNNPLEAGALLLRQVAENSTTEQIYGVQVPANDESYLAIRFVESIKKTQPRVVDLMAGLTALGYLFMVAEEVANPSTKRATDLRIILDGPLILDLLHCSGPTRRDALAQVLDDVRAAGAKIGTFDHCVSEARKALRTVLRAPARDRFGPTGDALRKGQISENALISLAQGFEPAVKAAGVEILPDSFEYLPANHKHFDDGKINQLESAINWHDPGKDDARDADLKTATFIIRRRAAHRSTDLFDAKFVAVTMNATFAGATRRRLIEINYYNSRQIAPVINLKELAAKTWLEVGNKNRGDRLKIPRSQLMMACEKSLRINRNVVERAKEALAAINSEQLKQFELLLEVPRSARAVVDAALNNENFVTGENVELLVEAAVQAAGSELAKREREAKEKAEKRHKEAIGRLSGDVAATKESLEQAISKVERAQAADRDLLDAVCEKNSRWAHRLIAICRTIGGCSVFASVILFVGRIYVNQISPIECVAYVLAIIMGGFSATNAPGAWLSDLIKRSFGARVISQVRDLGRTDLSNSLKVFWQNGKLEWEMESGPVIL